MKTVNWELFNAKQTDKYRLVSEDGTENLMDGVVTFATIRAVVSDGDSEFKKLYYIALEAPTEDNFTPLEDLSREDVLAWALDTLGSKKKESIEKFLLTKVGEDKTVDKIIFETPS